MATVTQLDNSIRNKGMKVAKLQLEIQQEIRAIAQLKKLLVVAKKEETVKAKSKAKTKAKPKVKLQSKM